MDANKAWLMIKPFLGVVVKGAKWYVKERYGVDVDKVLADQEKGATGARNGE